MKKVLVKCKNYNGIKNVLFMMDANDFRIAGTDDFGYVVLDDSPTKKGKVLKTKLGSFKIFPDWSLKLS